MGQSHLNIHTRLSILWEAVCKKRPAKMQILRSPGLNDWSSAPYDRRDRENEFCMLAFSCKSNIGSDIEWEDKGKIVPPKCKLCGPRPRSL